MKSFVSRIVPFLIVFACGFAVCWVVRDNTQASSVVAEDQIVITVVRPGEDPYCVTLTPFDITDTRGVRWRNTTLEPDSGSNGYKKPIWWLAVNGNQICAIETTPSNP